MYKNEKDWVYETEVFPFRCYVSGLEGGSSDVAGVVLSLVQAAGSSFELTYPADIVLGDVGDYVVVDALLGESIAAGSAGDMDYQLWVTSVHGIQRCVAQGTLRIVATL